MASPSQFIIRLEVEVMAICIEYTRGGGGGQSHSIHNYLLERGGGGSQSIHKMLEVGVVANPIQSIISEAVAKPIPIIIILEVDALHNPIPFILCIFEYV